MTEKQEQILQAALELFAKEGFKATSTSKVAKLAGVSEGLIFRHFRNKEGLLEAILREGEEQAKLLFADIVLETEPKQVILKCFQLYKNLAQDKARDDFWKLQFKIKWETERYGAHKMEPLRLALENAFQKLGHENPSMEAQRLLIEIDGLATRHYLDETFELVPMLDYLMACYDR